MVNYNYVAVRYNSQQQHVGKKSFRGKFRSLINFNYSSLFANKLLKGQTLRYKQCQLDGKSLLVQWRKRFN